MNNTVAGLFFLIVGTAFLFWSDRYDMGTYHALGPGFFPMIMSYGLIICGIALIVKARL